MTKLKIKTRRSRMLSGFLCALLTGSAVFGTLGAREVAAEDISATVYSSAEDSGDKINEGDVMTESQYAALGFKDGMDQAADDVLESDDDPLAGYTPVAPNELLVMVQNTGENDWNRTTYISDEADSLNADTLNYRAISRRALSGNYYLDFGSDEYAFNAVSVSVTDANDTENAVNTLNNQVVVKTALIYANDKCTQTVSVYSLKKGNKADDTVSINIGWDEDDWLTSMTVRQQAGLTSMTTGDFDGDGYEEVAVYVSSNQVTAHNTVYDMTSSSTPHSRSLRMIIKTRALRAAWRFIPIIQAAVSMRVFFRMIW